MARRFSLGWQRLALALIVGLLASCGSTSNDAASDGQTSTRTLRIGYQKGGSLPILKGNGALESRLKDVKVEWIEFAARPPLLESLNAGSIDLGSTKLRQFLPKLLARRWFMWPRSRLRLPAKPCSYRKIHQFKA